MTGLRDRFEEMAAETLVYGDMDRAIRTVARKRRRNVVTGAAAALALALAAAGLVATRGERSHLVPAGPPPTAKPSDAFLGTLPDGLLEPGRYRYAVKDLCETPQGCGGITPKPTLPALEITVPDGWDSSLEFSSLFPVQSRDTASRNNPALALGWTTYWVRMFSNPCHADNTTADLPVGPTVDDFVDAVTARPGLDVTEPKPVTLGKHSGRFFTLRAPADTGTCHEWRPWDPAPYAQGPSNIWDVWAINVDGIRVVIMTEYFPETPATIKTELRQMADSVRFVPRSQ